MADLLGAHMSISGGLHLAIDRAVAAFVKVGKAKGVI